MNPKQLEKMAKRMGIQASPIEAEEVIIKTPEKDIVISSPQVSKVNMMGQETWQITGDVSERPKENFTEEDIDTVVNQTGASREDVKEALEAAHGDLAEAIMKIKEKG
ncbi:MAG: nascent polypeptide-associated complex protein [Candidatus Aenigmatarchaeota archaeon]|nr:MAG: nascent polypeptide-associated complex protein [Candidatus Aenigmarchaeota archaeon]